VDAARLYKFFIIFFGRLNNNSYVCNIITEEKK